MNKKVEDYLKYLTKQYKKHERTDFSASAISKSLGLNRSTTSSYLNQGIKEGIVIKINGYPISFQYMINRHIFLRAMPVMEVFSFNRVVMSHLTD